jgi:hypothetical protein
MTFDFTDTPKDHHFEQLANNLLLQLDSNENTNRLLRQYLPISTGLRVHTQQKLSQVTRQLIALFLI